MSIDSYTKILQQYLQSKVIIKCNNKVIKTGKLTLFNVKQYFIRFYIESQKVLELPYPFLIEDHGENGCTLNYHLTSLCNNHTNTVNLLKGINRGSANKIYDNVINIIPFK